VNIKDFIDITPNTYLCVKNIAEILDKKGYQRIYNGKITADKVYEIKADASIVAMNLQGENGFNIIASHSDNPAFKLKPGFLSGEKPTFSPYGGMITHSWLDRPLSLSGRVITEENGTFTSNIININEDIAIIPSLAIHQMPDVNDGHKYNLQTELTPIFTVDITEKIKETVKGNIVGADLYLYVRNKSHKVGDLLVAPRIDDLACVHSSLEAFANAKGKNINVLAVFNNEEIGSNTQEGADSTFLSDMLKSACVYKNADFNEYLSSSMLISADNGHAYHQNYPEKSDPQHKVALGKGIMQKHHINYSTQGLTQGIFTVLCKNNNIPLQNFACRSDMRCGSTLGNISLSHLSVNSIDVGVPQLAMHSAVETCSLKDTENLTKAFKAFYSLGIKAENNQIKTY